MGKDELLARIAEEEAHLAALVGSQEEVFADGWKPCGKALNDCRRMSCARSSSERRQRRGSGHTRGEGEALPIPLPRTRRGFPNAFREQENRQTRICAGVHQQFVPGVCELPRIKCGDCPNQAFLPFNDQAILDHLQGRHVMGVYPLLSDETCWFLAVDFDKAAWQEDVTSFAETCRSVGVPVAVERSRSGNGAHAWFFFAAPLPASIARKMGCYLITETMARRHQISMGSYDRLFPNQDTMPRGGFGNLIALPLQQDVRKLGNTVFLDVNLEPFSDQ